MVYKFQVDKEKFQSIVKEKYAQYITDGNITLTRCYEMLCCDLNVCLRTVYNFIDNRYSIQLLMKIIKVLDIKYIEDIFNESY